jgi:hypothetical protein
MGIFRTRFNMLQGIIGLDSGQTLLTVALTFITPIIYKNNKSLPIEMGTNFLKMELVLLE